MSCEIQPARQRATYYPGDILSQDNICPGTICCGTKCRQTFVNHQKAPKPLKSNKNYQKHPNPPKIHGKVIISCQKFPFVAKNSHLFPKAYICCQNLLFVAKSYHLFQKVYICCQKFQFVAKSCQQFQKLPKVPTICQKWPKVAKKY